MQFRPEWNEPSDRYGTLAVARNLLPLILTYAAVPLLADHSAALACATIPVIGLLLYRLTIVMHDCGHGTLFRSRTTNNRVGMALGLVTGVDYHAFRRRHLEHHRNYGRAADPQAFHYAGLASMSRARRVGHVLKPLLGFNLPHVFDESYLAPANLRRLLTGGWLAPAAAIQLLLLATVSGLGRHPWALALPKVSAATVGLFLSQLRGIAEHGVSEESLQPGFARSHAGTVLDRILLSDLNFHLHDEHHRHPQVPSRHLPALSAASGRAPPAAGMLRTVLALLP